MTVVFDWDVKPQIKQTNPLAWKIFILKGQSRFKFCFKQGKEQHCDMSLVTRKHVFGVFDQVRLKSACSAAEHS